MDAFRRIAGLLKPYKKKIAYGLVFQLAFILARLAAPYMTQAVVNKVIIGEQTGMLPLLCGYILMLSAVRALSNYVRGLTFEQISQNVSYDLKTGLYQHLEEMPFGFYDTHRVGEIMSRMTGDLDSIRNLLAVGVTAIFDNGLCFAGSLIFMSFMSWQITLILMLLMPVIALTAWKFNKKISPAFTAIREQNAALNTRVQENLAGMRVVKAFAQEGYEEERFEKENRELLALNLKATWIWSGFIPLMDLMSSLCTPVALVGGTALIMSGRMDIGTLVGVIGYIWLLTNPMRMLSNIINMVAQAVTASEKLFYYIDLGSTIKEPADAVSPVAFRGRVEFDHVSFAYGDKQVLSDISFTAEPGQTIAVMGATGSGKTTLILLLGRFYDIRSGSIRVDGIDVRQHRLKALRRQIGYVPQETFLFSDTIADNISFGVPGSAPEEIASAAEAAQAAEFITKLPHEYDTIIGERGLGLSGGQKQRVAIARAVLTVPAILVQDDSTSAVDMETEYEIQQNMQKVLNGRTTFIIAHRISSVKNADQILVLDNGAIAERGTHRELLAREGIYYRMVMDQMSTAVRAEGGEAIG
jgi:ATP-binding cassette, subfamily B, multidrug efflux pump